jgi:hypothetical protein
MKNRDFSDSSIKQMRSKFRDKFLKIRGVQNSSDNGIEFLGFLLVRISYQMNFARLICILHSPAGVGVATNSDFIKMILCAKEAQSLEINCAPLTISVLSENGLYRFITYVTNPLSLRQAHMFWSSLIVSK